MAIKRRIGGVRKIKKYLLDDIEPRQKVLKPSKYTKKAIIPKKSVASLLHEQLSICKEHKLDVPIETVDLMARMSAHKAHNTIMFIRRGGELHTRSIMVLVDLYIMASLLYYGADKSVMPDAGYDRLCHYLYGRYEDIPRNYTILNNISLEALECGSGYDVKGSTYHCYAADYLYDFCTEGKVNDPIRKSSKRKKKILKTTKFLPKTSQSLTRPVSKRTAGIDRSGQHYETFETPTKIKRKIRLRSVRRK